MQNYHRTVLSKQGTKLRGYAIGTQWGVGKRGGLGPLRRAVGREGIEEERAGEPNPGETNLMASKLKTGRKAKKEIHGNIRGYLLSQYNGITGTLSVCKAYFVFRSFLDYIIEWLEPSRTLL